VAVAVLVFAVISGHLLGISAWVIESGSMDPNMHIGDLVFTRNVPSTGIITYKEVQQAATKRLATMVT